MARGGGGRGSGGGESVSTPEAATLVVSSTPGAGDYETIQDAVDNLPAEGGYILVREGTYDGAVLSDKPIIVKGCGRGSTVVDLGVADGAAFSSAFAQDYVIRDLSAIGTVGNAQVLINLTAAAEVLFENVESTDIQKIVTTDSNPEVVFTNCKLNMPAQANISFWDGSSTGGSLTWNYVEANVPQQSNIAISGQPDFTETGSYLGGGASLSTYDVGKILFQGFTYDHAIFTLNQPNSRVANVVGTDVEFIMKAKGLSIVGSDFIGVADINYLISKSGISGAINLRVADCTYDGGGVQHFMSLTTATAVFLSNTVLSNGEAAFMDLTSVTMSLTNCQFDGSVPSMTGSSITLIGTPTYAFTKSSALATADLLTVPGKGQPVTRATASVETPPSGDDVTVDVLLIDRTDGSTISTVGTLTIADGAFEGSVFFPDPVDVLETQALKASVDIGGSTGAADMVMLAS
jgi:hypothetical protein